MKFAMIHPLTMPEKERREREREYAAELVRKAALLGINLTVVIIDMRDLHLHTYKVQNH